MAAWIDADITLQSKYNVKTSFGHKFAAMYFVEMHIVLVESLISFRKLKASYDRDNEYFSNYMLFSETDFLPYLQKDVALLRNNLMQFYFLHFFTGIKKRMFNNTLNRFKLVRKIRTNTNFPIVYHKKKDSELER